MKESSKKSSKLEKMIELNEELENYFNNTIIPQLFVDADMILRKFTPAAMTQFDLSASDLGKHIDEVSNNIRFPTIIDNITEVIERSEGIEKEIQTTDKKWYQMNILPYIIRKEKRTNGVIITFIDINERIYILKGYEALNRSYENVIHSMSHDIKGPLSNIEGLLLVLKETPKSEEDNKLIIDMLSQTVGVLRKTVEELAAIDTDKEFGKEPERVNFENVIEDARLALRDKIAENSAKIILQIEETEINFSRKNIRSIIYNLLSNAIKYRKPDTAPEITISTKKSGDHVLLKVSDNGLGVAKDKQQSIFDRYIRLHETVEGTGVGLFIVKGMVESMGGRIEVESEEGKGSTFLIYFKSLQ